MEGEIREGWIMVLEGLLEWSYGLAKLAQISRTALSSARMETLILGQPSSPGRHSSAEDRSSWSLWLVNSRAWLSLTLRLWDSRLILCGHEHIGAALKLVLSQPGPMTAQVGRGKCNHTFWGTSAPTHNSKPTFVLYLPQPESSSFICLFKKGARSN